MVSGEVKIKLRPFSKSAAFVRRPSIVRRRPREGGAVDREKGNRLSDAAVGSGGKHCSEVDQRRFEEDGTVDAKATKWWTLREKKKQAVRIYQE
ncbi:hypothetical protein L2E82_45404 [Cichorium intybus]|uniref:Uncharacterized protein n=1 Tax=Cichorium intybus TaxID=13427 RepID=A0ACB8ZTV8_CICIN|nr:hypothetical protein L2E82_45404 [Cichorium intybus]